MLARTAALRVGASLLIAVAGCHGSDPRSDPVMPPSHLVVKLAEGCRLETGPGAAAGLLAADGDLFDPTPDLPKGTRIEYRVAELGKAPAASLSQEEADLARYLQVVLPAGAAAADYLRSVEGWPCVDSVTLSPEVALPADG